MTLSADNLTETVSEPRSAQAQALANTRPFYWSVRRELWESRAIYIAPLIAAGVVLFACLLGAAHFAQTFRTLAAKDPRIPIGIFLAPSAIAMVAIVVTVLIVAVFYCLGALHNERRDRSILFWKSLPVSDLITVLAKVSVPLLVMPIVALVVILVTELVIFALSLSILAGNGIDPAPVLHDLPPFTLVLALPYGLIVLSLWYAPIAGWLLLVSGWARKAPFLWAVLPPLAVGLVEKIAIGTSYVGQMIQYRLSGGLAEAFTIPPKGPLDPYALHMGGIDPLKFAACPGLWIGLVFAAAFVAAAVWMRRYREPI